MRLVNSAFRHRPLRVFLVIFFLAAAFQRLEAASGTSGAAFLNIPVGARPAALGGAYSALATDAYAPVWNPAGLGFTSGVELAAQHLSYLESIHDEYLGLALPKGFGLAAQYLGSGDIDGAALDGTPQGTYSSHYGAYTLAYGHALGERLSLGLAAKFLEAKLADVSAHAYAADWGFLYKATDRLSLAGGMTNLGSKLKFLNDSSSLPLTGKIALAYQPLNRIRLAVEADFPKEDSPSGHLGVEWSPLNLISLRAGYRTDNTKELGGATGFSAGAGLMVFGQELDYAWVPYGDLGDTHYISFVLHFGGNDERRNVIQSQHIKKSRTADNLDPEEQQFMELLNSGGDPTAQKTHGAGSGNVR